MTLDELTDVLLDGTTEKIASLVCAGASFDYDPYSRSITIRHDQVERRMHKLFQTPNCVSVYGNSHKF